MTTEDRESTVEGIKAILEILYAAGNHQELKRWVDDLEKHPELQEYACGLLLRPWLPRGIGQRIVMAAINIVIVVVLLLTSNLLVLLFLVFNVLFSPRAVGELAIFFGRLRKT